MTRPGYGTPHPEVRAFLASVEPVDVRPGDWRTSGLRFTVAAYFDAPAPPFLVTSARCVLWEGDRVVVCSTPDGPSVTPGGRLEPGESAVEATCREVYEETGRRVEPAALRYLGFVHYRHRDPMRPGYPYPYPDFFQVISTATVVPGPEPGPEPRPDWVDLAQDGWVLGHRLATVAEVEELPVTETERLFLRRSRAR